MALRYLLLFTSMIMKRLVSVLFAASVFVGACGPYWTHPGINGTVYQPGTWNVCIDLPLEQVPAAHKAVEAWDNSIGQWKHLRALDVGNNDVNMCRVYVHTTSEPNKDSPRALAWVNTIGGDDVSMMIGRYEQDVTGILQHELGHALGAQHVAGTLMNPGWDRNMFSCPDRTTVVQIAAWNHVNVDLFKWCYF